MLRLDRAAFDAICDTAFREYPLEMCGLIAGATKSDSDHSDSDHPDSDHPDSDHPESDQPDSDRAAHFYPCRNLAASAKVYTLDPRDFMRAEMDADDRNWEITGVVHSHTHSEPYPSPTDITQAPDPEWHYVIVGLKRDAPELRSYRIVDGDVTEEPVELV